MSRRAQIYVLAGLLAVLVYAVYLAVRPHVEGGPGLTGVLASDTKFEPLEVQEPQLRLDLLKKLQKLDYTGSHRNIFVVQPPPPPKPAGPVVAERPFVGPRLPPPPPPLQVPGEFFGYATQPQSGRKVGFFTNGDDVLVVAEGSTFLGRFRLVRIGNDSADVEEVSTGRHVTVPMVQPPADQVAN